MEQNIDEKQKRMINIFEWLDIIVSSIIIVVLLFTFVFRIVSIEGKSMEDTLFNGERVIVTNVFYTPKKGDVVVISRNSNNSVTNMQDKRPIIKRVIATEGQTVFINFDEGQVYVDGILLDEPYIKDYVLNHYSTTNKYDVEFPVVIKKDCIFVLGDNRIVSLDSRSSQIAPDGQISVKYVIGHAIFRVFPFNKMGAVK